MCRADLSVGDCPASAGCANCSAARPPLCSRPAMYPAYILASSGALYSCGKAESSTPRRGITAPKRVVHQRELCVRFQSGGASSVRASTRMHTCAECGLMNVCLLMRMHCLRGSSLGAMRSVPCAHLRCGLDQARAHARAGLRDACVAAGQRGAAHCRRAGRKHSTSAASRSCLRIRQRCEVGGGAHARVARAGRGARARGGGARRARAAGWRRGASARAVASARARRSAGGSRRAHVRRPGGARARAAHRAARARGGGPAAGVMQDVRMWSVPLFGTSGVPEPCAPPRCLRRPRGACADAMARPRAASARARRREACILCSVAGRMRSVLPGAAQVQLLAPGAPRRTPCGLRPAPRGPSLLSRP